MANRRPALWQISLDVSPEAEEPAAALLETLLGQTPVVYIDMETGRRFLSVYTTRPPGRMRRLELQRGLDALRTLGLPKDASLTCTRVRHRDWAQAWKLHFRPIHIARKLVVRPSWRQVARRPGRIIITLDPGLAFGTGHHPTTAFCLEQLTAFTRQGKAPRSLLDVGTGSGILAIAAAKLGYAPVVAFDKEQESVEIAEANARRNRVSHKIRFFRGDLRRLSGIEAGGFGVVCANLTSDLLCRYRARLSEPLIPGGHLVLAGILTKDFPGVARVFDAAGFQLLKSSQSGEWKSGSFKKEISGLAG